MRGRPRRPRVPAAVPIADHRNVRREPVAGKTRHRRLRVLFVCAMNRWRSPTAEQIYRSDPRLEVRSAGVRAEAARCLSARDLEWADVVFVMERGLKSRMAAKFRHLELPRVEVLDIPDEYGFMDLRLQELLRLSVEPELTSILSADDPSA